MLLLSDTTIWFCFGGAGFVCCCCCCCFSFVCLFCLFVWGCLEGFVIVFVFCLIAACLARYGGGGGGGGGDDDDDDDDDNDDDSNYNDDDDGDDDESNDNDDDNNKLLLYYYYSNNSDNHDNDDDDDDDSGEISTNPCWWCCNISFTYKTFNICPSVSRVLLSCENNFVQVFTSYPTPSANMLVTFTVRETAPFRNGNEDSLALHVRPAGSCLLRSVLCVVPKQVLSRFVCL